MTLDQTECPYLLDVPSQQQDAWDIRKRSPSRPVFETFYCMLCLQCVVSEFIITYFRLFHLCARLCLYVDIYMYISVCVCVLVLHEKRRIGTGDRLKQRLPVLINISRLRQTEYGFQKFLCEEVHLCSLQAVLNIIPDINIALQDCRGKWYSVF